MNGDKVTTIASASTSAPEADGNQRAGMGPVLGQLYKRIRQIQTGECEDKHGWMMELEL